MSGGKGGSQSTEVTIPPFIEAAARENLARAQRTAEMGYLPYYGPEVAAFSPMQEQAMRSTGSAAEAFGLAGPGFDPLAGIPRAQTFSGGLRGYGSGALHEESLGTLRNRSPEQFARYQALPTSTGRVGIGHFGSFAPTAPYGQLPPSSDQVFSGGEEGYGYTPMYSGPSFDYLNPETGTQFERQPNINPEIAALQQEMENLRSATSNQSSIQNQLSGIESQLGQLANANNYNPTYQGGGAVIDDAYGFANNTASQNPAIPMSNSQENLQQSPINRQQQEAANAEAIYQQAAEVAAQQQAAEVAAQQQAAEVAAQQMAQAAAMPQGGGAQLSNTGILNQLGGASNAPALNFGMGQPQYFSGISRGNPMLDINLV